MLISINENDPRPIYLQITGQVKEQVGNGLLLPRAELPSVRELAESLGINMHTVRSAYLKLRDDGIIKLRLGRRAIIARRIAPVKNSDLEGNIENRLKELVTDALLSGLPPDDLAKMLTDQVERLRQERKKK
jgi:GntR family transcriptional regulator